MASAAEMKKVNAPKVVSPNEWLVARTEFLQKEKEFTRLRDELSRQRRELPWEKVEKPYVFEGPNGQVTFAELFDGRGQLIVYHFMFGPGWEAGCPSCSYISSSCSNFQTCSGTMKSDQGWSAPITLTDGLSWYVRRDVPNWERCQDGTAFTGQQTFYFYPVDPEGSGEYQLGSPVMAGKDKTIGPSGACGQNQWLGIELPLRLDKIG